MNRDRIKGKAKDMLGRAERQAGEWTGDKKAQGEGLKNQVEGKAQNAWGKVKDAGAEMKRDLDRNRKASDANREEMEHKEPRGIHGVQRDKRAA